MDQLPISRPVVAEGVMSRLRVLSDTFSDAERRVAEFMVEAPGETVRLSVRSLAVRIGVSEATVVRTCQALGYTGLRELKLALAAETVTPLQMGYEDLEPDDSLLTLARKVVQANVQALADSLAMLNDGDLERAVAALLGASQLLICGVGASQGTALDAAYRLLRLGLPAQAVVDPYLQLATIALLPPGAMVFGISHSGRSPEIVEALRLARERGAATMLLTSHGGSDAARYADVELISASTNVKLYRDTIALRLAHLGLIDILCVAITLRRPEQAQQAMESTYDAFSRRRTWRTGR